MSLLFDMLSRFVITFLPRSKYFLISLLQSPSAAILEPPPKIKSKTVSTVSPSISHEVMGPDVMILVLSSLICSVQHYLGYGHLTSVWRKSMEDLYKRILQDRLDRKWYRLLLVTFSYWATTKWPRAAGKDNPAMSPGRRNGLCCNGEWGIGGLRPRSILKIHLERRRSWKNANKIHSVEIVWVVFHISQGIRLSHNAVNTSRFCKWIL